MPVESSLPDFYFHSISLSPEPTLLHVTMPHLLFCVRGYLNYWHLPIKELNQESSPKVRRYPDRWKTSKPITYLESRAPLLYVYGKSGFEATPMVELESESISLKEDRSNAS